MRQAARLPDSRWILDRTSLVQLARRSYGGSALTRRELHSRACFKNRFGKGTALELAEKVGFVSGHRLSDAASRVLSTAPLGAEVSISTPSATFLAVPSRAAIHAALAAEGRRQIVRNPFLKHTLTIDRGWRMASSPRATEREANRPFLRCCQSKSMSFVSAVEWDHRGGSGSRFAFSSSSK